MPVQDVPFFSAHDYLVRSQKVGYNTCMDQPIQPVITEDVRKLLQELLRGMQDELTVEVFTQAGTNDHYNAATTELVRTLAELSPKILPSFFTLDSEQAKLRGVAHTPTVLLAPDRLMMRFTGSPLGEEGRSFLMALLMISTGSVVITPKSVERLATLKEPRTIEIFVSPTCPYCPQQVMFGVCAAIARPDLISVDVIEIFEHQDIAEERGVFSVPQTFMNGVLVARGAEPEEFFIESLFTLKEPDLVLPEEPGGELQTDLLIIGAGPAGLTAAIYAGRSGLSTAVIERRMIGGQIMITPVVENYPGFAKIAGRSLVELMVQQALQYTKIRTSEGVLAVSHDAERYTVKTNRRTYLTKGIIIASGADPKLLDVPGEKELSGKGVSYCAECDGYFYKNGKRVIVVGGGNTAATEALYLHGLGADVTMVHRRDRLRAEDHLQESLRKAGVSVLWNTEVIEIAGKPSVKEVRVRNILSGEISSLPADGVFIAIGYVPNNDAARMMNLAMNEQGYIVVDTHQRTALPLVYAAGDVTGGIKQIAVAVGQGSIAAISAFEDIASPYWAKETPHA